MSHNINIVRKTTIYFMYLFDKHSLPDGFFNALLFKTKNKKNTKKQENKNQLKMYATIKNNLKNRYIKQLK